AGLPSCEEGCHIALVTHLLPPVGHRVDEGRSQDGGGDGREGRREEQGAKRAHHCGLHDDVRSPRTGRASTAPTSESVASGTLLPTSGNLVAAPGVLHLPVCPPRDTLV